jgi:hypothetical protein
MKAWHQQILDARSWQDLLQVTRSYVASFEPREWALLPVHCRPDRIKGVDDLEYWRQCLADEYLRVASQPSGNDVLRAMLAFFTAAAERADELCGTATPPGEGAMNDESGDPTRRALGRRE